MRLLSALSIVATVLSAQGPRDPKELEAFFDGVYAVQSEAFHAAGMALAVVRDGELLLLKGYGYADVDEHREVNPSSTLFRIGSISKTFVWTGLMQLAEQGKLDLKADVRLYANDVPIRDAIGMPITIEHLMTHTPGLEDRPTVGLFAREPAARSLADLLKDEVPARVFPPGEVMSYSNWGAALAGLILERVSGMSYDQYLEQNILQPLGMMRTTSRQPVPAEMKPHLAWGYRWSGGLHQRQGFEYVPLAPAGGMSATAADMARYMIAHLQFGRLGDARILEEPTARRMQTVLFTHHPRLAGWRHGFFEYPRGEATAFGHSGALLSFFSSMILFPETNTGLFFAYNSDAGIPALTATFNAFVDRYYPSEPPTPVQAQASAADRARAAAGWYTPTRRDRTGKTRLMLLLGAARIGPGEEGRLVITAPDSTQHFEEIEPWLYRDLKGKSFLMLHRDASGRVVRASGGLPIFELERISAWNTRWAQVLMLLPSLLLLLSAVVAFPLAGLTNRVRQSRPPPQARCARACAWLMAALLGAFVLLLGAGFSKGIDAVFGLPGFYNASGWFARFGALMALPMLYFLVQAWRQSFWSFWVRIHFTLVVLAGLVLALWAFRWNLM